MKSRLRTRSPPSFHSLEGIFRCLLFSSSKPRFSVPPTIRGVGANPVKSRNIELFPKKLWIHNSACRVQLVPGIDNSNNFLTYSNGAGAVKKANAITFNNSWCLFQFQIWLSGTYEAHTKYEICKFTDWIPVHQTALFVQSQHINAWHDLFIGAYVSGEGNLWIYTSIKCWDLEVMVWGMWPFRRTK